MKWILLFGALLLASPQPLLANESSLQFSCEPLKILHQVGKGKMTKAGIYHFPVPMHYTHIGPLLNSISRVTTLAEFTDVRDRDELPNVNLANLYGIKVSYDIVKDTSELDLTKVVRPEGEEFTVDEVIAMTMECVRLTGSYSKITIKTNETTKKWKVHEEAFRNRSIRAPFFQPKVVDLKTDDSDLVYHWNYFYGDPATEQPVPRFPIHGGAPRRFGGASTAYRGIGFSLKLVIFPEDDNGILAEVNQHVGYEFLLKDGVLTITAPPAANHSGPKFDVYRNSLDRIRAAVEYVRLSALANGDDFALRIVDPSISPEERSAIETQWSKRNHKKS